MSNHLVVSECSSIVSLLRRVAAALAREHDKADPLRRLVRGTLLAVGETLFQSNFDPTPINQPPAHVQKVGTANILHGSGSVIVVAPPVVLGKWVQIVRANNAEAPVARAAGQLSKFAGDGTYTFSTILFIPCGSPSRNVATIQFESFGQPVATLSSFLHIDFLQDNHVRIDDDEHEVRILSPATRLSSCR